ncbi:MAG: hypothetical protein N2745_10005 [Syntrophorhabdaceae bacterium]|nr:hypothetical protein [Syntrophorhabdaceae bacterium]
MRGFQKIKAILFSTIFVLSLFILFSFNLKAEKKGSPCIACHEKVTPGIVKQFSESPMNEIMDCSGCHGSAHSSEKDVEKASLPTPDTCGRCHSEKLKEFRDGKHALGWHAMKMLPMVTHQPVAVAGGGLKGCSGCHKIGDKDLKDIKRYGSGACNSCHTRHAFSVKEAKDPRACRTCHMGFDHPQWEMWQTSKHGTIWEIEGGDRAPTCQTCHMRNGSHRVMTAWGFFAVRLPEDDKEWLKDRVTILQALGALDEKGNKTERFDAFREAKILRLTKEEFEKEKEAKINVCAKCHSKRFAKDNYASSEEIIREVDKILAESIREVKRLYDRGIIKKPDGWKYAPDLLQFYEAKTVAEQELYLMFLEYRMRAFQGAFHSNPDYMHWYGWAKMKEAEKKIKEDVERLIKQNRHN